MRLTQNNKNKNKLKLGCVALGNKTVCVGRTTHCHPLLPAPSLSPTREICVIYGHPREPTACTRKGQSINRGDRDGGAAEILVGSHLCWPLLNADTAEYRKLRVFTPTLMSCLCTRKSGYWKVLLTGERLGYEQKSRWAGWDCLSRAQHEPCRSMALATGHWAPAEAGSH